MSPLLSSEVEPFTVKGLIRLARGQRTQAQFARILGVKQDVLCKYEKGRTNPPVSVIEHCMREVQKADNKGPPSANALAERVRTELAAANYGALRAAIASFLDAAGLNDRRRPTKAE
jgi:transcriptional regulator with XRE-family HTH domain